MILDFRGLMIGARSNTKRRYGANKLLEASPKTGETPVWRQSRVKSKRATPVERESGPGRWLFLEPIGQPNSEVFLIIGIELGVEREGVLAVFRAGRQAVDILVADEGDGSL